MNSSHKDSRLLVGILLLLASALAFSATPEELLQTLDEFPHAK